MINKKKTAFNLARMMDYECISARQAADRLGVHFSTIYHYRDGSRLPTLEHLVSLIELTDGKYKLEDIVDYCIDKENAV